MQSMPQILIESTACKLKDIKPDRLLFYSSVFIRSRNCQYSWPEFLKCIKHVLLSFCTCHIWHGFECVNKLELGQPFIKNTFLTQDTVDINFIKELPDTYVIYKTTWNCLAVLWYLSHECCLIYIRESFKIYWLISTKV